MKYSIVTAVFLLLFYPVFAELGARYEGRFFPVVTDIQVTGERQIPGGVRFWADFDKLRACEYLPGGLAWYRDGVRLVVEFPRSTGAVTRPPGPQSVDVIVRGVGSLSGTTSVTVHRCHPLWLTTTYVYPPSP